MLNNQDRDAIDGLFDRLETAAERSAPREPDAETLIQRRLRQTPAAPYYMAQTILVQEQALEGARQQIEALEAQLAGRSANTGFLGGLFGNGQPYRQNQRPQQQQRGPWDRGGNHGYGPGGGSFLANAAQTAMGVTGGILLGSAIAGLFSGDANAAEYSPPDQPTDNGTDPGNDAGGFGGDDGGDFDIGGDF
ncbi:DUF2076 domain-containing protein [Devosia sp.]|uniref:DUF2076 domain-containing protein n=1 Tax=Devosia sp. TaxID=1871048 RepID=UPI003267DBCD